MESMQRFKEVKKIGSNARSYIVAIFKYKYFVSEEILLHKIMHLCVFILLKIRYP